jgi:hypothetical protein
MYVAGESFKAKFGTQGEEVPGVTKWYNRQQAIVDSTTNLTLFNILVQARSDAGRVRQEKLSNFVVKGTWYLDEFGQMGKISQVQTWVESEKRYEQVDLHTAEVPTVMTREEFGAFLPKDTQWSYGMSGKELPLATVPCACCGILWTMDNTHDVHVEHTTEVIPLPMHVGETLSEVRDIFSKRTDACYFMQPDILIRNDDWINNEIDPKYETKLNEKGWSSASTTRKEWPLIDMHEYVIAEGDEAFFNVRRYYHLECFQRDLNSKVRKAFNSAIVKTGIEVYGSVSIPNEYGSELYRGTWFLFDTTRGMIKVGWRKRVITLNYFGSWGDYFKEGAVHDCAIAEHFNSYGELTQWLNAKIQEA